MRLPKPFYRLPIRFDVAKIAREVLRFRQTRGLSIPMPSQVTAPSA